MCLLAQNLERRDTFAVRSYRPAIVLLDCDLAIRTNGATALAFFSGRLPSAFCAAMIFFVDAQYVRLFGAVVDVCCADVLVDATDD